MNLKFYTRWLQMQTKTTQIFLKNYLVLSNTYHVFVINPGNCSRVLDNLFSRSLLMDPTIAKTTACISNACPLCGLWFSCNNFLPDCCCGQTFHPWCLVEYAKTYSKCVLPLCQFALGLLPRDKFLSKFSQGKIGINTFCISKGGHNRLFNIRYGFQIRVLHFISYHENSGTELNHMNSIEPHAKLYHMNKLLSPCCLS